MKHKKKDDKAFNRNVGILLLIMLFGFIINRDLLIILGLFGATVLYLKIIKTF